VRWAPEGLARRAGYGTFWGDHPSIRQLPVMAQAGEDSFSAPNRLKSESKY
jgi:hypothetical protein